MFVMHPFECVWEFCCSSGLIWYAVHIEKHHFSSFLLIRSYLLLLENLPWCKHVISRGILIRWSGRWYFRQILSIHTEQKYLALFDGTLYLFIFGKSFLIEFKLSRCMLLHAIYSRSLTLQPPWSVFIKPKWSLLTTYCDVTNEWYPVLHTQP